MKITAESTESAILDELGHRLARVRLERNLTSAELAAAAGVGAATLVRLEGGKGANLTSLIRVLRALGMLDELDALIPEQSISPLESARNELQGERRRRQRASGRRAGATPAHAPVGWRWGDER